MALFTWVCIRVFVCVLVYACTCVTVRYACRYNTCVWRENFCHANGRARVTPVPVVAVSAKSEIIATPLSVCRKNLILVENFRIFRVGICNGSRKSRIYTALSEMKTDRSPSGICIYPYENINTRYSLHDTAMLCTVIYSCTEIDSQLCSDNIWRNNVQFRRN